MFKILFLPLSIELSRSGSKEKLTTRAGYSSPLTTFSAAYIITKYYLSILLYANYKKKNKVIKEYKVSSLSGGINERPIGVREAWLKP